MCAGAHATAHVEVIGQPMGILSPSTMWVPEIKFSLSGSGNLLENVSLPVYRNVPLRLDRNLSLCLTCDAKDAVRSKEEPGLRLSFWCSRPTPWRKPAVTRSPALAQCILPVSPVRRQKLTGYFASVVNCEGLHIERQRS